MAVSHLRCQPGEASWMMACQNVQAGEAEVRNGEVDDMGTHLLAARNTPELPQEAASAKTPRAA